MEGMGNTNKGIARRRRKKRLRIINKPHCRGRIIRNRFDPPKKSKVFCILIQIVVQSQLPRLLLIFFFAQQTIRNKTAYRGTLRMHKTKTELLNLIADIKPKKEFEKEINTLYRLYDELMDKDTIAYLLVDQLGRNTQSITKIADLTVNGEYTVVGTVQNISDSKSFKRKNGSPGKVVNLEIADESGSCRLVLWNGDIDSIKNKVIKPGVRVKIINGYTKAGYTGGMEVHLGRWGLLQVEPAVASSSQQTQSVCEDLTGVLLLKEPTKAFFKDDGEVGFVTTITMKEQNTQKKLVLWDRNVKDIQPCRIGETITVRNITKKWCNGKTEFHVTSDGSVKKQG
jgi:replication factor A1